MSQFNAPTYDIARPTGQCAFTGATLRPGQHYIAALVEVDPAEQAEARNPTGFKRVDISLEAWQQGHRPPRLFGHWKTTLPLPNQKPRVFVDDSVLLDMLRRLQDATEAHRLAFRFVLCLVLLRRKLLRYDGVQRRPSAASNVTQDWWQVTPKLDVTKGPMGKWNEAEKLEILDPHLDEPQVRQVTQQLGEILQSEL